MNLAEGIEQELERNRELLKTYEDIGGHGVFGASVIRMEIKATERAQADGDTVALLGCYERLKGNE